MSALTLTQLDDDTLRLLEQRAAQNHRGVEEEAAAIVREAVATSAPRTWPAHWVHRLRTEVDSVGGADLEIPPRVVEDDCLTFIK